MSFDWLVLFSDSLNLSVVLVLAALGGLLQMRSGIVNIAIEGQLVIGALAGFIVSAHFESFWLGILGAAIAGAIAGTAVTAVIVYLRGNEILVGLGFNVLAVGAIGYVLKSVLGVSGTMSDPNVVQIPHVDAVSEEWPSALTALLNGHDVLYFVAVTLLIALQLLLSRTRIGLRIRAVGLSAPISTAVGLRVNLLRLTVGGAAGALIGVAGSDLSLGQVGLFNLQMVAGRGFIALAAFYFGRSAPVPTAIACLVFAVFDSLQVQLQLMEFSANLVSTLPYVMVIIALTASQALQLLRSKRRLAS